MSDNHDPKRRRVLKVLAVGSAAATTAGVYQNPAFGQAKPRPQIDVGTEDTGLRLRFFSPAEYRLVGTISDLIIPTDAHSPGARDAGVPAFIDLLLSESATDTKKLWRDGLAAVEAMSRKMFDREFGRTKQEDQVKLLTEISRNEFKPVTLEDRFFVAAKTLTINAYYTSEIGIHQDLRYTGNSYKKDFPGCTHAEHKQA